MTKQVDEAKRIRHMTKDAGVEVTISFMTTAEQRTELKGEAKKRRMSASEFIRQAINEKIWRER